MKRARYSVRQLLTLFTAVAFVVFLGALLFEWVRGSLSWSDLFVVIPVLLGSGAVFVQVAAMSRSRGARYRQMEAPASVMVTTAAPSRGDDFYSDFRSSTDGSRPGSVLWNPPDRMQVGRKERIEVRLADMEVSLDEILTTLRGKNAVRTGLLELGSRMRVRLIGDTQDFSIQELGSADQALLPGRIACWDFDVTPLRGGQRLLRLLVTIRMVVQSKDEVMDLPSYEHEVEVRIAPLYATGRFLAANWQWVAGTIVLPLFIWAMAGTGLATRVLSMLGAPAAESANTVSK